MGMPEFTPVETPAAGHQIGAGRASLNQETSFMLLTNPGW